MAGWYGARTRSGKAVMAMVLLALALVVAVPAALLVGVVMMLLGHVIGGLAVFGGSILVATAATVLAGRSGVRYLRRLASEHSFSVLQLGSDDYTYVR
jgi:uncharacterized membrane protein YdjX (TVP38/TMEM64 family)